MAGCLALGLLLSGSGCVERLLQIRSDPPGARVFVNGEDAGMTPLDYPFAFYGTFGIVLRREGHESAGVIHRVSPPWYEIFPLDFFVENALPWTLEDHHLVSVRLEPLTAPIDRALEEDLERRAAEAREYAAPPEAAPPERDS